MKKFIYLKKDHTGKRTLKVQYSRNKKHMLKLIRTHNKMKMSARYAYIGSYNKKRYERLQRKINIKNNKIEKEQQEELFLSIAR